VTGIDAEKMLDGYPERLVAILEGERKFRIELNWAVALVSIFVLVAVELSH
jgi:hypothetical protein